MRKTKDVSAGQILKWTRFVFILVSVGFLAAASDGSNPDDTGSDPRNGGLDPRNPPPAVLDSDTEWDDPNSASASRRISNLPGSAGNYKIIPLFDTGKFITVYEALQGGEYNIYARILKDDSTLLPSSSEFAVSTRAGNQRNPYAIVAADEAGDISINMVWTDYSSGSAKVYFNRADIDLTALAFGANGIDLGLGNSNIEAVGMVYSNLSGLIFIVYLEELPGTSDKYLKGIKIDADGNVLGSSISICDYLSNKRRVDVKYLENTASEDESIVVGWEDFRTANWTPYLQTIDIMPSVGIHGGWNSNGVMVDAGAQNMSFETLFSAGDGIVLFVAYEVYQGSDWDVEMAIFNDTGNKTIEHNVNSTNTDDQLGPTVRLAGNSKVAVVFQEGSAGNFNIYCFVLDLFSDNPPVTITVCDNLSNQVNPSIAYTGSGVFSVFWDDYRDTGTSGVNIYGQSIDSSTSSLKWASNGVPIVKKNGDQKNPIVYSDPGNPGDMCVFCEDFSDGADPKLDAQITTNTGLLFRPNRISNLVKGPLTINYSQPSVNNVNLTWTDMSHIETVQKVQRSGSLAGFSNYQEVNANITSLQLILNNFTPSRNVFRIVAQSTIGGNTSVSPVSNVVLLDVFSTPSNYNLTALPNSKVRISFDWNPVVGLPPPLQFKIVRRITGQPVFAEAATVLFSAGTVNSNGSRSYRFDMSGLQTDTTYEFSVRGDSPNGTSLFTQIQQVTTSNDPGSGNPTPPPSSPSEPPPGSEEPPGSFIPDPPPANTPQPESIQTSGHSGPRNGICYLATASYQNYGQNSVRTLMESRRLYSRRSIAALQMSEAYSVIAPSAAGKIANKSSGRLIAIYLSLVTGRLFIVVLSLCALILMIFGCYRIKYSCEDQNVRLLKREIE
ncbi:MAG: fibronectin type III domain-containing protein [Planctomycetes bacterium]|nr:fibronectin type III domain-containing protein [Planctomycetota bacterium]